MQHPDGHDVASHTHAPLTHRCPVPHAGPAPHRHAPPAQPSPRAPQAAHAAPLPPHCAADVAVTHWFPLQHPDAHDVASHTQLPAMHRCPLPHAGPVPHRHAPLTQLSDEGPQVMHAAPLVLHEAAVGGATQALPLQHPEGQLDGSQTHVPLKQRWPDAQAGPAPHRQAPPAQASVTPEHTAHAPPPPPHAAAAVPA